MARRFDRLDIYGQVAVALDEDKNVLLDLQKEQFTDGKKSTGNPILPLYAKSTVKRKIRKGLPTDRVTLYETGKYYQEMYALINSQGLEIGSDVEYEKYIDRRYNQGDALYGLNEKNRQIFRRVLETTLIKNVARILHV